MEIRCPACAMWLCLGSGEDATEAGRPLDLCVEVVRTALEPYRCPHCQKRWVMTWTILPGGVEEFNLVRAK